MAALTVQEVDLDGLDPAYAAAAAGGDSFPFSPRTVLHVKNGSGASINVTLQSQALCDQGVEHDVVVAVPAGDDRMIKPGSDRFADAAGDVQVAYSAVTTVTVAVLRI